jgi:hypothetical protein
MSLTGISKMPSLTLTDGNSEVVEHCQQNMNWGQATDPSVEPQLVQLYEQEGG